MHLSPATLNDLYGRPLGGYPGLAFSPQKNALRRVDRLVELVHGLRVLHVGCGGQPERMTSQIADGDFLYAHLCRQAAWCVGVDSDPLVVEQLRALGFLDTYLGAQVPEPAPDPPYDICLIAEVLTLQPNPANYLASLLRYRFRHLMVVVPNALYWRNFVGRAPAIDSQHRVVFTPLGLCRLLLDAGFQPERLELCHGDYSTRRGALEARVRGREPLRRETLIVHAKPAP